MGHNPGSRTRRRTEGEHMGETYNEPRETLDMYGFKIGTIFSSSFCVFVLDPPYHKGSSGGSENVSKVAIKYTVCHPNGACMKLY